MTWRTRFRMFFGVIAVSLLVLALTVALSHRKGETEASAASVAAISYPVGTDFPGTVIEQFVEQGDTVAIGDSIARIQSTQLLQTLDSGDAIPDSEVYRIGDDGTVTVLASVNGIVDTFEVQQGGYAGPGSTIVTVSSIDSLYVSASFILDARDFERIEDGARVEIQLPNNDLLDGSVKSIEVETRGDGKAFVTAHVIIDSDDFLAQGDLMKPGTPVDATLSLRNDDLLATSVAELRSLIADVRQALFA
jgi:multidrug resistance efflux pump